jgi:hypothetical protein
MPAAVVCDEPAAARQVKAVELFVCFPSLLCYAMLCYAIFAVTTPCRVCADSILSCFLPPLAKKCRADSCFEHFRAPIPLALPPRDVR